MMSREYFDVSMKCLNWILFKNTIFVGQKTGGKALLKTDNYKAPFLYQLILHNLFIK